jgi:hypothetical protein
MPAQININCIYNKNYDLVIDEEVLATTWMRSNAIILLFSANTITKIGFVLF